MPEKLMQKTDLGLQWCLWEIDQEAENGSRIHEGFFDMEKFRRISHPEIRAQYLAARKALACITGPHGQLRFLPNGKPVYEPSGVVSLSHTIGLAAACFHPVRACGIDIEWVTRKFPDRVIHRFVHTEEMDTAQHLGPVHYWCAKEAIYKAHGTPGLIFNTHIRVYWETISDTLKTGFALTEGGKKWAIENHLIDGIVVSIATET
ncbi:MAG: 4'-phosphopantetheinyl transferase superfamily protein [Cryomorphaceae bacterium]|nr:4'-phosphopantetheinyl transferase superfamily protein [Cryomorphaceae bacterium]